MTSLTFAKVGGTVVCLAAAISMACYVLDQWRAPQPRLPPSTPRPHRGQPKGKFNRQQPYGRIPREQRTGRRSRVETTTTSTIVDVPPMEDSYSEVWPSNNEAMPVAGAISTRLDDQEDEEHMHPSDGTFEDGPEVHFIPSPPSSSSDSY